MQAQLSYETEVNPEAKTREKYPNATIMPALLRQKREGYHPITGLEVIECQPYHGYEVFAHARGKYPIGFGSDEATAWADAASFPRSFPR